MIQRTCELCGGGFEVDRPSRTQRFCSHKCSNTGRYPLFWERVAADPGDCWLWFASLNNNGYGRVHGRYAHRVAYEAFFGAVPDGLELDHLCRNPPCVNPYHLEAVTHGENLRRAWKHRQRANDRHRAVAMQVVRDATSTERRAG